MNDIETNNTLLTRLFMFKKKYKNHWMKHDGSSWEKDYILDKCYPKFDTLNLEDSINKYIDMYISDLRQLKKKYPQNIKIFFSDELDSNYGKKKLLSFIRLQFMIIYFKILFLISVIFPFNIDNTQNEYYENTNPNGFNKKMITSNKFDSQIIDQHIDESTYIIGSGDVFLFNMITTNGVITLDLTVSPSGDILIPIVGKVNLLGKTLLDSYQIINDKCKEKYEDAYVYVNLIKLRQFKVLVTGETTEAGMHIVTANNRVSDLFESIFTFSHIDTLLSYHIQDYPKNIMINKDITLIRDNKEIPVNLFDYYFNGKKENNPILLEQDIISLRNTNKITIIGAVEKQIRVQNQSNITYKDLINLSGINPTKGEMDKIKFLNSSSISSLYLNEKNRISNIDPKYRSDTDESFLSARNKTLNGIIYINDKEKLANFLDQSPIDGDILIVPQKVIG